MTIASDLESRVAQLNVDRSGGERKPHKPLLLLYAISRLVNFEQREIPFEQVRKDLLPLLGAYAPPVKAKPEPKLPYWYLRNDGVWEVPGSDQFELQVGDFPRMAGLKKSRGRIPDKFAQALLANPSLVRRIVQRILDEHFEPSLHEDVLAAVGFDRDVRPAPGESLWQDGVYEGESQTVQRRRRSAHFHDEVLSAYDRRCALSGFQAMISGTLFGVEAAHVHWHSKGGPSCVANGIALNPILHKLFDHGAWTLTDDRRVLVSREFSGSDSAIAILRPLHGQRLRDPLQGCDPVRPAFIRWHRERELGGVFRWPALELKISGRR